MTPGLWQIAIIAVVFIVIFGGRGKISSILSDLGKGIKSFKKGMADEEKDEPKAPKTIDHTPNKSADKNAEDTPNKTKGK